MLYESEYYGVVPIGDSIAHYQVKGAKHGVRRWQNEDGSLTPAGYIHYGVGQGNKSSGERSAKRKSGREEKAATKAMAKNTKLAKSGKLTVSDLPETDGKKKWLDADAEVNKAFEAYRSKEESFYGDYELYKKYATKSAEASWADSGWDEKDHDYWVRLFVEGDLDQGEKTAYDYYIEEKHPKLAKGVKTATAKSVNATKAYAKEVFGSDSAEATNWLTKAKLREGRKNRR